MQIQITGQQIDLGSSLRSYIESALEGTISKYFEDAVKARRVVVAAGYGDGQHGFVAVAQQSCRLFDALYGDVIPRRHVEGILKSHHKSGFGQPRDVEYIVKSYILAKMTVNVADGFRNFPKVQRRKNPLPVGEIKAAVDADEHLQQYGLYRGAAAGLVVVALAPYRGKRLADKVDFLVGDV